MDQTDIIRVVTGFPRLKEIGEESYEPRGIFNSEMALVLGLSRELKIDLFIESGRARGQSTYLLAKYLPDVEIHSFERKRNADAAFAEQRLAGFSNLKLHYGNAHTTILPLIRAHPSRRLALLLDGPKRRRAMELLAESIAISAGMVLGFVHDTAALDHGRPSASRGFAEAYFPSMFFSDAPAYVAATSALDGPVWAIDEKRSHWRPYVGDGGDAGSYGPTIGAVVVTDEDRSGCVTRKRRGSLLTRVRWTLGRLGDRRATRTPRAC